MMRIKRLFRHLLYPGWWVARCFPDRVMDRIEAAVSASEAGHRGEIRFAVEGALDLLPLLRDVSARERALAMFAELGVWDTEANNGVLVYVLLADHDVEIIADRGFNDCVSPAQWRAICQEMEALFADGGFEAGALIGIERIHELLVRHFPRLGDAADRNELPDRPIRI
jgi:hypothetical protein